ncbi:hybrid sensor histidine kinase/response regulator transcription factor [Aquimarina agarivorans]|uniref:hybrid sensor histidine kinase/response regulator transcription factor n=1 Tax=Aquimarina agarivorans TaxID=980584 RepID=UPI000248F8FB|nr:ATP-binding protein [Aquimarina agarivorans]
MSFFLDDAYHFNKKDGTFYYGGYQDIIYFNPKNIRKKHQKTKAVIENFYLSNKLIKVGDTIDEKVVLTERLKDHSTIKLNYKQNSFSFSFDANPINYFQPSKFRYKLEGLQKKWIYQNQQTPLASYTTVPPGNYVFKTSVQNSDQTWSPPFNLRISIAPPFWKTSWFKILCMAILFLGCYLFVQLRTIQLKKSKIRLANKVEEQTKILKEQNNQIREISEKLHEADQSKLQLFTNISHEFRTPLTLILGHLEESNKNKFEHTKIIIKKNANRLLEMVNQLIEVRKIDEKQMQLKVTEFDIVAFAKDIVTSFQILAIDKNISLNFSTSDPAIKIWLDSEKVEKIIFNLLTNAIKYSPNDATIHVELQQNNNDIKLIVQDNGIGISEKSLSLIFDRFYRINQENFEGHGIGLAYVKGLVEVQHGSINAESKLDEGSTFIVAFKKGKDHFNECDMLTLQTSQTKSTIDYTTKKTAKTNFGYTILIVEDNVELTNYIVSLLEDAYCLKTASNGKEGIEVLKHCNPDLIISDIMMPVMDGVAFCSTVKSNIETSHIPFILLSAITNIETKIKGFTLGIDSYIEKPFNPSELLARIDALLSNRNLLKKHLLSYNSQNESTKKWLNECDANFWKKVNTLIDENYADYDFNAEKLAPLLYMSRATFYRKFKDLTGLNIAEHIRKKRLHKAKELLLNETVNIGELGTLVGFKSSSQFRTNFKAEFGDTPLQYLKKQKG